MGSAGADPSEMFRVLPWPFPDDTFPRRLGAVVMRSVADGEYPALQVVHTPGNGWLIADGVGDPNAPGACVAVHIWHVLASDPSLLELASLPPGRVADRGAPQEPWQITRFEWDNED